MTELALDFLYEQVLINFTFFRISIQLESTVQNNYSRDPDMVDRDY